MKDEIKEILELYKDDDIQYYNSCETLGYDKLLDYIINLQEENNTLKNQLDFIEEQNHIIDKLEKENEIIKSQLNICSQDLYMENLKLKLENEKLKLSKDTKCASEILCECLHNEYKSRCEKSLKALHNSKEYKVMKELEFNKNMSILIKLDKLLSGDE